MPTTRACLGIGLCLMALICDQGARGEPSSYPPPPKPPSGKIFRFRLPFDHVSLDWNLGDVHPLLAQNTMRGLYRIDKQGQVLPDLAASGAASDSGRVWKFKIRGDVLWSDDVPLHAQQFVESIKRLVSPALSSPYAYYFHDLKEVAAPDGKTIEFRFGREIANLPGILALPIAFPIRADLINRYPDHWNNPDHMAFLGSYKVSEIRADIRVVMTPNPHATPKPWFYRVEGWLVPEEKTAVELYERGHLELILDPGTEARRIPELRYYDSATAFYVGVSAGHPLTASRAGILALSAALDRSEIPELLGVPHDPSVKVCPNWVWEETPAGENAIPLQGSKALAKKYLNEAGIKPGRALPPLLIQFSEKSAMKTIAPWLAKQWRENLGLKVELEGHEPRFYPIALRRAPAPAFVMAKELNFPDPTSFFSVFSRESPLNFGKWKDPDYDGWIQKRDFARASHRILNERPALIPLYVKKTGLAFKPFVTGVEVNAYTGVDLSQARYSLLESKTPKKPSP